MNKLSVLSVTQATNKFLKRRKRFFLKNSKGLTAFERGVYEEVKKVPKGHVATYGQIAQAMRVPRAARAVGNALNKNIFLDVPCHRVVRANGEVGGYAWGSEKKIAMLKSEGIHIDDNQIDLLIYGTGQYS